MSDQRPEIPSSLQELLHSRQSCRAFRAEPLPRELIGQILEMSQLSPSWCNAQPWRVEITSGGATERFREVLLAPADGEDAPPDFAWPKEYCGVYQERRRESGMALYDAVGIQRGDRAASAVQAQQNLRFFGAPHVAIVTTDAALGTYGAVDCGVYVSNFLLAAASLGVATIAQASIAMRPGRVRKFFGLPTERLVVCGVSFGWPDAGHPANGFRTTRAALDDVVTFHE